MAGQLKVDSINADSNLSFRIANTAVAFIDSNGLRPVSGNVSLDSTGTTGIRLPAANTLAFFEGGVEAVRIDSSGDVGIGTTSPGGYKLAVGDGSSNRGRIMLKGATSGSYPEINIDDTMNASGKNYQIFSTGGHLKVQNQTDAAVSFVANAFGIGLADNAPVDGDGIRFPATQNASSNANTLDDYEEGTFTPFYQPEIGSFSSITYSEQFGAYTKIGNRVWVQGRIRTNSLSVGSASGALFMGGLPFTNTDNSTTSRNAGSISIASSWGGDYPSASFVESNSTAITLLHRTSVNGATLNTEISDMGTGSGANQIFYSATYFVS
jgi:hypothetical protein